MKFLVGLLVQLSCNIFQLPGSRSATIVQYGTVHFGKQILRVLSYLSVWSDIQLK